MGSIIYFVIDFIYPDITDSDRAKKEEEIKNAARKASIERASKLASRSVEASHVTHKPIPVLGPEDLKMSSRKLLVVSMNQRTLRLVNEIMLKFKNDPLDFFHNETCSDRDPSLEALSIFVLKKQGKCWLQFIHNSTSTTNTSDLEDHGQAVEGWLLKVLGGEMPWN